MDYIGTNCPACNECFKQGDDVVVCPECGTPHHRECYELTNKCVYTEKHNEGFVYVSDDSTSDEEQVKEKNNNDVVICARCKAENPKNMFYCGKCGFPLAIKQQDNTAQNNESPYKMNGVAFDPFDPMGGIDPAIDMGENVTAGEISKYVQKNTSYFLRVFSGIKDFKRNRFSFVGFIFGGGYLLYRKMYKLGSILTAITAVLLLLQLFLTMTPQYNEYVQTINELYNNAPSYLNNEFLNNFSDTLQNMSLSSQLIVLLINLSSGLRIAIRVIVGINANKWYFKHCKKRISEIKNKPNDNEKLDFETKGGVNTPLAISLYFAYLIISYLPYFVTLI